jgi:hypothetical protein
MIRPGAGWLIIRVICGAFGGVPLPDDQLSGVGQEQGPLTASARPGRGVSSARASQHARRRQIARDA